MKLLKVPNYIVVLAVFAFLTLVIIQCVMFFVLPVIVPLITGAALAVYGGILSVVVLRRFWLSQSVVKALVVVVVTIIWLGWVFVPTHELSLQVRFWLDHASYEHAVAQIARGEQPDCLIAYDCILVGKNAPYVVFPLPGLLSGWIGFVHVPTSDQAPSIDRLRTIASDASCDSRLLAPHYYVCSFY